MIQFKVSIYNFKNKREGFHSDVKMLSVCKYLYLTSRK